MNDKISEALHALFIDGKRLVLWHTDTYARAKLAFEDTVAAIEKRPALQATVKRIRRTNGDQEVELLDGARLIFRAAHLARGYSHDLVIAG